MKVLINWAGLVLLKIFEAILRRMQQRGMVPQLKVVLMIISLVILALMAVEHRQRFAECNLKMNCSTFHLKLKQKLTVDNFKFSKLKYIDHESRHPRNRVSPRSLSIRPTDYNLLFSLLFCGNLCVCVWGGGTNS